MRKNLKLLYNEAPYLRPLISTLAIYLSFVCLLTLNPFKFSLFYFNQFFEFRRGIITAVLYSSSIGDAILNLLMLIPLGFMIGLLLNIYHLRIKQVIIIATISGLSISSMIEISQLFLPRSSSIIDIFMNTIGTGVGARLAYPIYGIDPQQIFYKLYVKGTRFYCQFIIIYCIIAVLIILIPALVNNFSNWDKNYHLLLGNEATMNRSWQGTIYKLSIFNRILNNEEIKKIYHINFQQETPIEFSDGLLVEYIFGNSTVKISGMLNKKLIFIPHYQNSNVKENSGIEFNDNSIIPTKTAATELVDLLQKKNQLTIAIWFLPNSLQQAGPARIVSLSADPEHRNFTLGQIAQRLNLRVRTPFTGHNGSDVELITSPILSIDEPQFIVASFNRGEAQIFYNGQTVLPTIYNGSYYLPLLVGLRNDRFGKIAFCFMLLFPLGWLGRGMANTRMWKSIVSSLIIIAPLMISSLINHLFFHHTLDLHLIYAGSIVFLLLLLIGLIYDFILD